MKSLLLSLTAVLALAFAPVQAQDLAIGETAPMVDAPLINIDGSNLTMNGLKKDNGLLVSLKHTAGCSSSNGPSQADRQEAMSLMLFAYTSQTWSFCNNTAV